MNNYCTKCGKKINPGDNKCSNCNTPVVNLYNSEENKKSRSNFLEFIGIIFSLLCLWIFASCFYKFVIIPRQYKDVYTKEVKKELEKYNVESWNLLSQRVCTVCTGGCDGACGIPEKIKNCYEFKTFIQVDKNNTIEKTFVVNEKQIDKSKFEDLKQDIDKITIKTNLNVSDNNIDYINKLYTVSIQSSLADSLRNGLLDKLNTAHNKLLSAERIKVSFSDNYELEYIDGYFNILLKHFIIFRGQYGQTSIEDIISELELAKDNND